jgi:hypothetical protein
MLPSIALTLLLLGLVAGHARADAYRVFDWEGKTAPLEPTSGPSGAGAVTHTTYLNGGQYSNGGTLFSMNVSLDVTVQTWSDPSRWKIDNEGMISGTQPANYGYQTPDEAEFSFGNPSGRFVMRVDINFSQPVDNPSFFLLDIDAFGGDRGTQFQGTRQGGGTVYPTLNVVAGSTVAWTGTGPTLDVFSAGPSSSDQQALGAAFFEWNAQGVTSLSFVWESNLNTSIRLSNIYADFNPAGFIFSIPEPSVPMLSLLFAGGLSFRRRRSAAG